MRRGAAALCLVLAACGAVPGAPPAAPPAPVLPPLPASDTCGAAVLAPALGQDATALERILVMRPIRILRPGTPVTEDFSAARVNVHVDALNVVQAVSCG